MPPRCESKYDVTKVFLGQIHVACQKPDVQDFLSKRGFWPTDVFVPEMKGECPNPMVRYCFAQFDNQADASACIEMIEGDSDTSITPTKVTASIIVSQHGSLYSFCSTQCL